MFSCFSKAPIGTDLEQEFYALEDAHSNNGPDAAPSRFQKGLSRSNCNKNRYTDIIALDRTMVTLSQGSYINANWVRDAPNTVRYAPQPFIMAQAPTCETMGDFFSLLYQYRISVIVCLTPLVECGKVKATRYWPANKAESVGVASYIMTVEEEDSFCRGAIVRRTMRLAFRDSSRSTATGSLSSSSDNEDPGDLIFTMFHYMNWSDQASPACLDSFSELIRLVRSVADVDRSRPVLAHCSAGVGRAGTFVAAYNLILLSEMLSDEGMSSSSSSISAASTATTITSTASSANNNTSTIITATTTTVSAANGSMGPLSSSVELSVSSAPASSNNNTSASSERVRKVSVQEMVDWLRHQRYGAVQTVSQYKFIPKVVALFEDAASSSDSLSLSTSSDDSNEEEECWLRTCQFGSGLRVR